ncbi:MAG: hypothetical protein DMF58_10465 [Acidobacteria bacterium]|nr:MAG: hypothetical protein DMF58_10465 [Acidobacteriota bacterium]
MRNPICRDEQELRVISVLSGKHLNYPRVENAFEESIRRILDEAQEAFSIAFQLTGGRAVARTDAIDPFESLLPAAAQQLRKFHPEEPPQISIGELHGQERMVRRKSASAVRRRR